jgi:large subunit ribosomal protein L29
MKARELREITVAELKVKVEELEKELFKTKFQASSKNVLKNPMLINNLRKDIARIKTILTEKASSKKKA